MRTHSNNLVIVCEGTDTEYQYFTDLKDYVMVHYPDRYCAIKVVPVPEERIDRKNPKRKHLARKLSNVPQFRYYCKYEDNAEDYNLYCAQPTRYVREAALFMKEDGYAEGWAVFDCDQHPAREEAFRYAKQANVGIAFSSYSFEEWLLAHFERCPNPFMHSECKANDKEIRCGSLAAGYGDCHGTDCIGGRLRQQQYIADYSKGKKELFKTYTLPMIKNAMINAAWLRYKSPVAIWNSNPFTDVDLLVTRMLGITEEYRWYSMNSKVRYGGNVIRIIRDNNDLVMINEGRVSVVIPEGQSVFLDNDLSVISLNGRIMLQPDDSCQLAIPNNAIGFMLTDGNCNNIIEIS